MRPRALGSCWAAGSAFSRPGPRWPGREPIGRCPLRADGLNAVQTCPSLRRRPLCPSGQEWVLESSPVGTAPALRKPRTGLCGVSPGRTPHDVRPPWAGWGFRLLVPRPGHRVTGQEQATGPATHADERGDLPNAGGSFCPRVPRKGPTRTFQNQSRPRTQIAPILRATGNDRCHLLKGTPGEQGTDGTAVPSTCVMRLPRGAPGR